MRPTAQQSTSADFQAAEASEPGVTVVVVTYDNADHIDDCMRSIHSQLPDERSRVIVFDSASTDNTAQIVEERWSHVKLMRSAVNVGFAQGCNQGARGIKSRFILLINPDAILQPGCIDALLKAASRYPFAGVYGGRNYTSDGKLDPTSCFGRPTLWGHWCFATGLSSVFPRSKLLNPDAMGAWLGDTERPVGVVSGFLLLVDRLLWERLGGFDERFFVYGEDFDLSIRAFDLGYQPMITPEAGIIHIGGGSSSAANKQVLLFQGKVTLVRALWSGPKRTAAECMLIGGVWVRARLAGMREALSVRSPHRQLPPRVWAVLWQRRSEWRDGAPFVRS